ncbi:MAG: hypothetical protein L0Y54_20885 [Sporichthyaceae bacterium]|nr:hypothetical protein [Sporichthyaceae bacterium]
MAIKDELKTNLDKVTESTAFHAVAGASDLAAEKIRNVPAKLAELDLPGKIDNLQGNLQGRLDTLQGTLQTRLDELQGKLSGLKVDPKDVQAKAQTSARELPERVTDLAMQLTGKAVQTYGELAQRGKVVVDRRRGVTPEADLPVVTTEVVREPVKPAVERVTPADIATDVTPATPTASTGTVSTPATPAATTKPKAAKANGAGTKTGETSVPPARKTPSSKPSSNSGKSTKS